MWTGVRVTWRIPIGGRCHRIWRRQWHPIPVLLPGKSHGWRSLEGCSPWCHWGSDMTERLSFHFSLSYIGKGNGNPLQCSCLENPRDGGAWWAAVYGVSESRTQLKWLSSSSSSSSHDIPQESVGFLTSSFPDFLCCVSVSASPARSPVFSHLASSLRGLRTIRAYKAEKSFQELFDAYQDLHSGL